MARPKRPTAAERRTIEAFIQALEADRPAWAGNITSSRGDKVIRLDLTIPASTLAKALQAT